MEKVERGKKRWRGWTGGRERRRMVGWEGGRERLVERRGTEMSLIFHQSISFKFEIDCTRVE